MKKMEITFYLEKRRLLAFVNNLLLPSSFSLMLFCQHTKHLKLSRNLNISLHTFQHSPVVPLPANIKGIANKNSRDTFIIIINGLSPKTLLE